MKQLEADLAKLTKQNILLESKLAPARVDWKKYIGRKWTISQMTIPSKLFLVLIWLGFVSLVMNVSFIATLVFPSHCFEDVQFDHNKEDSFKTVQVCNHPGEKRAYLICGLSLISLGLAIYTTWRLYMTQSRTMTVHRVIPVPSNDMRADTLSLSDIKHNDCGLAEVIYRDGLTSLSLYVSLELLAQCLAQPSFSLNASHADTVVRINQTLRNLHTVNDSIYLSLDGYYVRQHTSKLAEFVTAAERFRLQAINFPVPK